MKKVLIVFMIIAVALSLSLVACQKKEAPKAKETVTEPVGGYGEKEAPKAGGYGEETAPEAGGYGEKAAPETPGYGEKAAPGY